MTTEKIPEVFNLDSRHSSCDSNAGELFMNLPVYRTNLGTAVALWLRCCATNGKVAGSNIHRVIPR